MGHEEIYEWYAVCYNGRRLSNMDFKFDDLPFDEIISVVLRPLLETYPLIRYPSCGERIIYFRRVQWDLTHDNIERVRYVIGKDGDYCVLEYPTKKFTIIKELSELDEI